mgnify:CR=1 FL=1
MVAHSRGGRRSVFVRPYQLYLARQAFPGRFAGEDVPLRIDLPAQPPTELLRQPRATGSSRSAGARPRAPSGSPCPSMLGREELHDGSDDHHHRHHGEAAEGARRPLSPFRRGRLRPARRLPSSSSASSSCWALGSPAGTSRFLPTTAGNCGSWPAGWCSSSAWASASPARASWAGARRARRQSAMAARHPDQPWFADSPWDPQGTPTTRPPLAPAVSSSPPSSSSSWRRSTSSGATPSTGPTPSRSGSWSGACSSSRTSSSTS